ncbi:Aminotransferase [Hyphodiscus hymeniophilus]|uniref:Aminotransferase n=1 Tax=Hyphodiscus hymeniophilus TaxID=353542 RepID=A0A9P6SJL8_9HELO|nr:Aminotransferase [Hyphodiscus hymeniophilus]
MVFAPLPRADLVHGHVESSFSTETGAWSDLKFVEDPFLRVHGLAPALNYGQQAFEGMKAFRFPDGSIAIFRTKDHAERFNRSSSVVSIPQIPTSHFIRAVHLAVARNGEFVPPHGKKGALMYIRPVIFGSSAGLSLNPAKEYTFCVYTQPINAYHGLNPLDALILEDYDRCAPRGTGAAKIGGNYAPIMRWTESGKKSGFQTILHLDSKTNSYIEEFSSSGFLGVQSDRGKPETLKIVVPDSTNFVPSITSDSCIAYDEMPSFREVLAVGTAATIVAIRSITSLSRQQRFTYVEEDQHKESSVTNHYAANKLTDTLWRIQQGLEDDVFGWCDKVQEPNSDASIFSGP